ncbi:MAG: high frequency lysogenization protein HflD [Patescibacteria group bacterium]
MNNNFGLDYLNAVLKDPQFSAVTIFGLSVAAFVFGMSHTLTPGHGKSMIGAYMASINGKLTDAVVMALSTTLSHTGIITLLALIFAFLRNGLDWSWIKIPPQDFRSFIPYLTTFSGLAIIGIAFWIFNSRLLDLIKFKEDEAVHHFQHTNDLDHAHLNHTDEYTEKAELTHSNEQGHEHHHHDHFHDDHHLNQSSAASTTSGNSLVIHHHGHSHIVPSKRLTLREAIALGLSNGLTPCIDAVAILIIAINLDRIWLGIYIILIFSLGMAATLTAIGYGVGHGIKLFQKRSNNQEIVLWIPIYSALLIAALGLMLLIQVRG